MLAARIMECCGGGEGGVGGSCAVEAKVVFYWQMMREADFGSLCFQREKENKITLCVCGYLYSVGQKYR